MAHQAWPGTTTGHSKHSSESISEHQEEQAEESEDEQRATVDDEEQEDEGDGDDECQGGVLGHRGPRSCHRNLSTPIPFIDRIAILLLRGNLLNATSFFSLFGHSLGCYDHSCAHFRDLSHSNTRDTYGVVVWGHFCPLQTPIQDWRVPNMAHF